MAAGIARLQKALLAWFEREARDLPWRRTRDPYHIWLSEILLQQTRVDQGLPYYERFLAAFPDVRSLAAAAPGDVMKLWEGLGYYTRARNLHKAARTVVEKHGGEVPGTAALLQLLPGVGRYTANAVASIAYGEPVPVVDGNVKRVLSRLYDIADPVDTAAACQRLWELAERLLPARRAGDFNQAMMELGARVCTPKAPRCAECPVSGQCAARKRGTAAQRPVRRPRRAVPHREIVVAAIRDADGRYLVGRRPPEGLLGGLWELPGGKVEPGETHHEALVRECREELGVNVRVGGLIAEVRHAYTHLRVTLSVYRCALLSGEPAPRHHEELAWLAPDEFARYPFPRANHKFLHLLR